MPIATSDPLFQSLELGALGRRAWLRADIHAARPLATRTATRTIRR